MGLDTSHGAWHGAYSAFMTWRTKIAEVAGFPPLELMEGYYSEEGFDNPFGLLDFKFPKNSDALEMAQLNRIRKRLPIKWDLFGNHPLIPLLTHSDCEGDISYGNCKRIADALEKLIPLLPDEDAGGHIGNWRKKTETFIEGLRCAYEKKEKLIFR